MVVVAGQRPAAGPDRVRVPGNDGRFRTPARLNQAPPRRGRVVIAGAAAVAVTALPVALATAAQASHSGPASPGPVAARVTVHSGQSLWSLASAYDPHADPRTVIEQIRQMNSLPGYQVPAGAVLWVPRG